MELNENADVEFTPYDIYVAAFAVNAALQMVKRDMLVAQDGNQKAMQESLHVVLKKFRRVLPEDKNPMQFPLSVEPKKR